MAGDMFLLNFSAKNPPLRQAAKRYPKTASPDVNVESCDIDLYTCVWIENRTQ